MGPCSDEHGNIYRIGSVGETERLQWGRALMSTEISGPDGSIVWPLGLQWGRALMSTEMRFF